MYYWILCVLIHSQTCPTVIRGCCSPKTIWHQLVFQRWTPYLEGLPGDGVVLVPPCPWLPAPWVQAVPEHVDVEEDVLLVGQVGPPELDHQLPEDVRGAADEHHCEKGRRHGDTAAFRGQRSLGFMSLSVSRIQWLEKMTEHCYTHTRHHRLSVDGHHFPQWDAQRKQRQLLAAGKY